MPPPLGPERWQRLKRLFEGASELAEENQAEYVRQHEDDEEVIAQVLQLLANDRSGVALSGLRGRGGDAQPLIGSRLGPFEIVSLLGRGGMSEVYLGRRDDGQFEQHVAVKVLRDDLLDRDTGNAAMQEQRLLARLDHPGIARIIDAGVSELGLPYFAMDYVAGRPLARYCEETNAGLRTRLELIARVADALDHAHSNLVLHRDVKPDNILVSDDGRPKLVDFGIARVIERSSGHARTGMATQQGWSALTPEFASPEQIRGEALTTSTDVYSLGVTLYVLLTGSRPYHFERRNAEEIVRVLDGPAAPAPSRRVRELGAGPVDGKRLVGDLDVITQKAMHRDPQRRYRSAAAFANDIRAHLRAEPVVARGDSLFYRATKFLRRHRVGVAMSAAVIVLVAAASFALVRENQAKLAAAERAQVLNDFLLNVFDGFSPDQLDGEPLTVRELLAENADRAERELATQPDALATLLIKIAGGQLDLANTAAAQPLVERVQSLVSAKPMPPDVRAAALSLGARIAGMTGDRLLASAKYEQALAVLLRETPDDETRLIAAYANLSGAKRLEPDLVAARQYAEAGIELAQRRNIVNADTGQLKSHLAGVLFREGDYRGMVDTLRAGIRELESLAEAEPTRIAALYHNLGVGLGRLGLKEASVEAYEHSVATYRRVLGEQHPRYAEVLHGLGMAYDGIDDQQKAYEAQRKAATILREKQPKGPATAGAVSATGIALSKLGRPEEGLIWVDEALTLAEVRDGELGFSAIITLMFRSKLQIEMRRFAEAEAGIADARSRIVRGDLFVKIPQARTVDLMLAVDQTKLAVYGGRLAEAVGRVEEELPGVTDIATRDDVARQGVAAMRAWYSVALHQLGRLPEADQHWTFAVAEAEAIGDSGLSRNVEAARAYRDEGRVIRTGTE